MQIYNTVKFIMVCWIRQAGWQPVINFIAAIIEQTVKVGGEYTYFAIWGCGKIYKRFVSF